MLSYKNVIILFLLLISLGFLIEQEVLTVRSNNRLVWYKEVESGFEFTLQHLHSVQKTPVKENFRIDSGQLFLVSTAYQSYGAGLPFFADDNYSLIDDYFVLDNLEQEFAEISLRTGKIANHILKYNNGKYRFIEDIEEHALIIIEVEDISLVELLTWEVKQWIKIRS